MRFLKQVGSVLRYTLKKPIYDIPGFPEILAGDLTQNLVEQGKQFEPNNIYSVQEYGKGNIGELKLLKQNFPHLKVLISSQNYRLVKRIV